MDTASNFQLGEIMSDEEFVISDIISMNLALGSCVSGKGTVKTVSDRFRRNRMGIYCSQTIPSCLSIVSIGGKRDENNLSFVQSKSKAQIER